LLLNQLPGRHLERLLGLRRRPERRDPDGDDCDSELDELWFRVQCRSDALARLVDAFAQERAQLGAGEVVPDDLLRELVEHRLQPLDRCAQPAAGVEVDREVDPPGEQLRVGDTEADHALHPDALKVGRASLEAKVELAVIERELRHRGDERTEPERESLSGASEPAASVVQRLHARLAAKVPGKRVFADLGHRRLLSVACVILIIVRMTRNASVRECWSA
jgi:hypothetical protein